MNVRLFTPEEEEKLGWIGLEEREDGESFEKRILEDFGKTKKKKPFLLPVPAEFGRKKRLFTLPFLVNQKLQKPFTFLSTQEPSVSLSTVMPRYKAIPEDDKELREMKIATLLTALLGTAMTKDPMIGITSALEGFSKTYENLLNKRLEEEERRQKALQTASLLQENIKKERIRGLEAERKWYEETYPFAEQRFDIPRYQEILEELDMSIPTTEEITRRVITSGISPISIDWGRFKEMGLPSTIGTTIPEFVKKEIRRVPILPKKEPKEPKVIVESGNIYTYNPKTDEFTFRIAIPKTKEELEKIKLDLKKKRAELDTEYAKEKLTKEQYNTELEIQEKIEAEISKIKVETLGKIEKQVEPPKPTKLEKIQEQIATVIYQKLIETGKGKLNEKAIKEFATKGFEFSTKEAGDIVLFPKSLSSNTWNILEKMLNKEGFTLNSPYVLQKRQPQ
ncbi:MAG: hypothetical protein AB1567_08595, partial [bacterium]